MGGTDYIIPPLRFTTGALSYISYSTNHDGGFEDWHLELVKSIVPLASSRVELESSYYASRSLLQLYLGRYADDRVMDGEINGQKGEHIKTAVLLCKITNFYEQMACSDARRFTERLNIVYEAICASVKRYGSELIRLGGDEIIAHFSFGLTNRQVACRLVSVPPMRL